MLVSDKETRAMSTIATTKPTPQERFQSLAAEWKQRVRNMSNTAPMAMLRPYQRIIGMGHVALPFILEELERDPDQWFWAQLAFARPTNCRELFCCLGRKTGTGQFQH